jgi:hypothetical protein
MFANVIGDWPQCCQQTCEAPIHSLNQQSAKSICVPARFFNLLVLDNDHLPHPFCCTCPLPWAVAHGLAKSTANAVDVPLYTAADQSKTAPVYHHQTIRFTKKLSLLAAFAFYTAFSASSRRELNTSKNGRHHRSKSD